MFVDPRGNNKIQSGCGTVMACIYEVDRSTSGNCYDLLWVEGVATNWFCGLCLRIWMDFRRCSMDAVFLWEISASEGKRSNVYIQELKHNFVCCNRSLSEKKYGKKASEKA